MLIDRGSLPSYDDGVETPYEIETNELRTVYGLRTVYKRNDDDLSVGRVIVSVQRKVLVQDSGAIDIAACNWDGICPSNWLAIPHTSITAPFRVEWRDIPMVTEEEVNSAS